MEGEEVITYYNRVLGRKIHRKEACKIDLTVEQYMEAIPWWAQKAPHAWKLAAELKWCNEAWKVKSLAAKVRRVKMIGASHRQGSCSHARYKKKLEQENKRPISDIEAYAMARRGDQEGTFCNQNTADKISEISRCLQDGYNTLAMIIQTHLKVPIPPLVLPQLTDSSHQGTSGGSNTGHMMNDAGRGEVGEVNPIED
ncbi:hypothetical protein EJB05_28555 [Eragrostis curvula]|uniref:Uncharacterized protein n=1 Tax=Eragrostis curvula TaxID=38414 RepID=A0A5J9URR1_9POAL|nr:hypothetical protein EJB05_28555 [Eragrostis curvula]